MIHIIALIMLVSKANLVELMQPSPFNNGTCSDWYTPSLAGGGLFVLFECVIWVSYFVRF